MLPVADMTNGVKVGCLTCKIHSLYCFFFLLLSMYYKILCYYMVLRLGSEPLRQKKLFWPLHQSPLALTFLSDLFAVFSGNISPLNGCNCGPIPSSFQNSVNKFTVLFRIWLWRKVTIPPFGHWRARCKLNILPHAQWLGIRFYL